MADTPKRPALTSKHRKTLASIREKPTRGDIKWSSVIALMKSLGAITDNKRSGSRVGFALNGKVFILHKPHPKSELSKGAVEDLRNFVRGCGDH